MSILVIAEHDNNNLKGYGNDLESLKNWVINYSVDLIIFTDIFLLPYLPTLLLLRPLFPLPLELLLIFAVINAFSKQFIDSLYNS